MGVVNSLITDLLAPSIDGPVDVEQEKGLSETHNIETD